MMTGYKPYPHYKPSGIDWLKDIPAQWDVEKGKWIWKRERRPVRPIDEIVTAFRDGTVTLRKNRREDGFTNSLQEIGYQGIRKGDLVIHGMDAFAGAIGVSDSDGKSTPVYSVCTPVGDANPYYYAYLLKEMSRTGYIQSLARGIRERSTEFKYPQFASLLYPLPPLAEQTAIANFLDRKTAQIDAFVSLKEKTIALLQEQKTAIINRAVTQGLNPDVPMKNSGIEWLGQIPAHWEVQKVKYLAQILRGKFTHRPRNDPQMYNGPYPFIQTGEVSSANKYITKYHQTLSEEGYKVSKEFPEGTLVMTIAGALVGAVAILNFKSCFPDSVVGFVPAKEVKVDFLFYLFKAMWQQLVETAPVNTQPNLNIDRIGALVTVLPPLLEQHQIVAHIEQATTKIDRAIAQARQQIDLIKEYRESLISQVVTGKIKIIDKE